MVPVERHHGAPRSKLLAFASIILLWLACYGHPTDARIARDGSQASLVQGQEENKGTGSSSRRRSMQQLHRQAMRYHLQLDKQSSNFDTMQLATNGNSAFLHIPKTGGTTVEEVLRKKGILTPKYMFSTRAGGAPLKHECKEENNGFVKHFTPDQMTRCKAQVNPYEGKTVFCFIRDPVDRVISELKYRKMICEKYYTPQAHALWNLQHFGRAPAKATYEYELLTFTNAVAFYVENLDRRTIGSDVPNRLSDHLVHLQPQSWYLFNEKGEQTCHKVKLMEDLGIGERRNTSGKEGAKVSEELRNRLKDMLWKAYREDFLLVEQLTRMRELQ